MDESNNRLREARKGAGFKSARAAAIRFGWTPSTYASHENGQTPVPKDAAKTYAKAFKVDQAWLMNLAPIKEGSKKRGQLSENDFIESGLGSDHVLGLDETAAIVPEIDLRAGAGYAGGFAQEENTTNAAGITTSKDVVRMNWGIPIPFLRDELHLNPKQVHILPVRGDSMQEALFDGDRAIADLDDTDISQGGIFALLDDNASLIIKQVEVVRGSKGKRILCTSRNPSYAPFELELSDTVRIIGRIAGRITRL